jgi:hypothetical protein
MPPALLDRGYPPGLNSALWIEMMPVETHLALLLFVLRIQDSAMNNI